MVRSLQRLKQIATPDSYEDQKTASEIANTETTAEDFEQTLHGILSQLKRIIHGDNTGNWFDNPVTSQNNSYKEVNCLSGDSIGNPIYITGTDVSGKWQVSTADPTNDAKMPAIGILVSKSTSTSGIVQVLGVCDLFTEMTPGRPILIGNSGNLIEQVPSIPQGQYFWAQQIGVAVSDDLLLLNGLNSMIRYSG